MTHQDEALAPRTDAQQLTTRQRRAALMLSMSPVALFFAILFGINLPSALVMLGYFYLSGSCTRGISSCLSPRILALGVLASVVIALLVTPGFRRLARKNLAEDQLRDG